MSQPEFCLFVVDNTDKETWPREFKLGPLSFSFDMVTESPTCFNNHLEKKKSSMYGIFVLEVSLMLILKMYNLSNIPELRETLDKRRLC